MHSTKENWVAIVFMNRQVDEQLNGRNFDIESQKPKKISLFKQVRRRLIQWYISGQSFSHIEIAFPEDSPKKKCLSFSAYGKTGLEMKERTYENPAYELIYISVTSAERAQIQTFCEASVCVSNEIRERGGRSVYDESGMFWSQIWPVYNDSKYWCLTFVVRALQKIGMFAYVKAETFTIDDAMAYLQLHKRSLKGLPYRVSSGTQVPTKEKKKGKK
jgi:hypothetical protein